MGYAGAESEFSTQMHRVGSGSSCIPGKSGMGDFSIPGDLVPELLFHLESLSGFSMKYFKMPQFHPVVKEKKVETFVLQNRKAISSPALFPDVPCLCRYESGRRISAQQL